MRVVRLDALFGLLALVSWCGCGGAGRDVCEGVVCDQPPADHCADASTLLRHDASGVCDPATGDCTYQISEFDCPHGCAAGRCLDQDLCRGVICDEPPANSCKDTDTLLVYPAAGSCEPDTGGCVYEADERSCAHGCEDGACLDQDPCEGVVCNTPPANVCRDADTLLVYEEQGSCDPATGQCAYDATEEECVHGCTSGQCLVPTEAWGWIAVIEMNDVYDWQGGVRAVLAEDFHRLIGLPHHLPRYCTLLAEAGDCALYTARDTRIQPCEPPCGAMQECVCEDGDCFCRDLPARFDAGTITIEGLSIEASMDPDEYGLYALTPSTDDLFDQGDPVTASASGGELEPFSLSATGVAHLEIDRSEVQMLRGEPATISWTPADPGTRIQVLLLAGPHDPASPSAALLCDAPDDAGKVQIDATLVDGFIDRHVVIQKFSRITRYTSDIQQPFGRDLELFTGSARRLDLLMP